MPNFEYIDNETDFTNESANQATFYDECLWKTINKNTNESDKKVGDDVDEELEA